jgi:hypothetical protein
VTATDGSLAQATAVARALVDDEVEVSSLATQGRNSRIFRVCCATRVFALKQYPSRQDDPRDRLATEVNALRLMERYRIETVPRVLGVDAERGYALLSWLDGISIGTISDADIDAAIAFLHAIHGLRTTPWAGQQPLAAEACLRGEEIVRQIGGRLTRLKEVATNEPELSDFIGFYLSPQIEAAIHEAREQVRSVGLDFAAELPQEWRSLVPSDFGFHNSLRLSDGTLAFVDFEYFGWDDPVKLVADIMLHPGHELQASQRKRFRELAVSLYGADEGFAHRLSAYLPLFGLRWVLIVLNEFIPERWQRRVTAGETRSWNDVKAYQIARARALLNSLLQISKE